MRKSTFVIKMCLVLLLFTCFGGFIDHSFTEGESHYEQLANDEEPDPLMNDEEPDPIS